MPRPYTVPFAFATVTNAGGDTDLWELTPADDKPIEIFGLEVYTTSELAEAQEEWLGLSIIRGHATSGNGGAVTPTPLNSIDTASGFTAETNGTTIASTGTAVTSWVGGCQVRNGLQIWWPQGAGHWASQANTLIVVRMTTTVADDVTLGGTLYVNEYP